MQIQYSTALPRRSRSGARRSDFETHNLMMITVNLYTRTHTRDLVTFISQTFAFIDRPRVPTVDFTTTACFALPARSPGPSRLRSWNKRRADFHHTSSKQQPGWLHLLGCTTSWAKTQTEVLHLLRQTVGIHKPMSRRRK